MAYTKQTFTSGQTLKASDLNTMSQGIKDLDDGKQEKLVSGTSIKTINGQSLLGGGNITVGGGSGGTVTIDTNSIVYVNAVTGDDNNDGSENAPKKTFANALQTSGDNTTIIFEGDTSEPLNIKTKPTQKVLRVYGKEGKINRILMGTKIDSATLVSGYTNVYQVSLASIPSTGKSYTIYQHDVNDATTAITADKRSPYQRSRTHRLQSTKITKGSSLSSVQSSSAYTYYYDSSAKKLYFKCPNTDLGKHPIYLPVADGGIYGNDGTCKVEFENIEVWYGPLLVEYCHGGRLINCAGKFGLGTGAIRYDMSIGIEFIKCEACCANDGNSYGDGINGHSDLDADFASNDPTALHTSCHLIDCWVHDNNDDGWSDHTRCEAIVRGGLYEYNTKGGVTPSGGANCVCYGVHSRYNHRGFYYITASSTAKQSINGSMTCFDCLAEDNSIAGFKGTSDTANVPTYVRLIDCKSLRNAVGYYSNSNTTMELIDCTTLGDATKTKAVGSLTVRETNWINRVINSGSTGGDTGGDSGGSGGGSDINNFAWEVGAIVNAGAEAGNKAATNRIRTAGCINVSSYNTITATPSDGYAVAVYHYDKDTVTGSALNTPSWKTEPVTLNRTVSSGVTYIRIALKRTDDADMTTSESVNVTVTAE